MADRGQAIRVPAAVLDPRDREAARRLAAGLDVSCETWARLETHVAQLLIWHRRFDLVSPGTIAGLWTRHVLDSLQLLPFADRPGRLVDLGSGAGFPGLVLALARRDPAAGEVVLVESNHKKCAFLQDVIRRTGAPARTLAARIGDVAPALAVGTTVVTARALAPLDALLGLAAPFLESGAQAVFPKGAEADRELTEARRSWTFDVESHASLTDPRARILVIRNARRV